MPELNATTDILKVDDELGLVFGYAIVCRELDDKGEWQDHYDTQGHHIPEAEMLKGSVEFAQSSSIDRALAVAKSFLGDLSEGEVLTDATVTKLVKAASKDMHEGDDIQDVVQMFPVTEELAKALDWQIKKTGLVIALKPTADVLKQYKNGERTGFSIGGTGTLVAA